MLYAVVSDIHANRTALRAIEEFLKTLPGSERPKFWVLGDLLGYGPNSEALECINWLRFSSGVGQRWIPGNHDEWALTQLGNDHPDATVKLLSQILWMNEKDYPERKESWEWFMYEVSQAIAELPNQEEQRSLVVETFEDENQPACLKLVFTHGTYAQSTRRSQYLYPWLSSMIENDLKRLRMVEDARTICLLHGHTHFPIFAHLAENGELQYHSIRYGKPEVLPDGYVAINPGSVGQPRDGDPRAAFVLLDTDSHTVTFYRVPYPVHQVVEKLRRENLTELAHRKRLVEELKKRGISLECRENGQVVKRYRNYYELIDDVYESLINRLEKGDGKLNLQYYQQIYRRPEWDLEVIEK